MGFALCTESVKVSLYADCTAQIELMHNKTKYCLQTLRTTGQRRTLSIKLILIEFAPQHFKFGPFSNLRVNHLTAIVFCVQDALRRTKTEGEQGEAH